MTIVSKSLFHISEDMQAILNLLEEMDGEFTPDMEQVLIISQQELAIKTESYIHVLHKLYADVRMAKEHEDAAKAYRTKKGKIIERLENALLDATLRFGKIETGIHTVSTRKSESIVITHEEQLPNDFKIMKLTTSPDKAAIKKAIKAGESVPGAELVTNNNLSIK